MSKNSQNDKLSTQIAKESNGIKCRQCGSVVQEMFKYGPFCSSRCRTLDLASWAVEEYRIPEEEQGFKKPVETVPSFYLTSFHRTSESY